MRLRAALDLGSASIKAVAVDGDGVVRVRVRHPLRGRLHRCLVTVLEKLAAGADASPCRLVAVTGAGAEPSAELLGLSRVNEIEAAYRGALRLAPRAGAVLEVGAEHSLFIRLGRRGDRAALRDFHVNTVCSAGAGAFLEQEAHRLNLTIEEFSRRAAEAEHAVRIAGRCAVFAKTDIVHKHQGGVPRDDIPYALCLAVARNIRAGVMAGRKFDPPLVLVGGVAENHGVRRALRTVLDLPRGALVVPDDHAFAVAHGSLEAGCAGGRTLREALTRLRSEPPVLASSRDILAPLRGPSPRASASPDPGRAPVPNGHHLGIDIGSTSTNVAWVTPEGEVVDHASLATRGDPLEAVRGCLGQLRQRRGEVSPRTVGVTGSGRRLVAEMLGADLAVNEITAHAAGGTHLHPDVDSILDIGGQDSKFIQLVDGAVAGFEMNKVCAAGTGSFLEEMSGLLGLDVVGELAREAFHSRAPLDLGDRCTVFMGSELARKLREGCRRVDLAAGLCYAIAHNYLARVVGRRRIGEKILFQGGVAGNEAVVAALEQVLGRRVRVHEHHQEAGAIGAALLAAERTRGPTRYKGPGALVATAIRTEYFDCGRCANECGIHVTSTSAGDRFHSGGMCDRHDGRGPRGPRKAENGSPDLIAEVVAALGSGMKPPAAEGERLVGIPLALVVHDLLPFWSAFFSLLGVEHAFSDPTTGRTLERGAALCPTNACLPLKIAYGHCLDLVDRGVRRLLIPSVANLAFRTVPERLSHICPVAQAWPYTAKALLPDGIELLTPRIRFSLPHVLARDMVALGRSLGAGRRDSLAALEEGKRAQQSFQEHMRRRGQELPEARDGREVRVALLSRSYTVFDPLVSSRLRRVLDDVGLTAIPMDMLTDEPLSSGSLQGMYWYYGKRILQVARALRKAGGPPVVFLSSFGCGPDSFLVHMLRRELGRVPLLELEVDEHSEFTGIRTRLDAFKYALESRPSRPVVRSASAPAPLEGIGSRELLIPRMSDHAFAVSAAFRSRGVNARVLPPPDEESTTLGRMAVGGSECLPCAFVLGDMLRHLEHRPAEDPPPAFFMVSGDGPCRLGQYPWLQREALKEAGYPDVPLISAIQDPTFYEQFGAVDPALMRTMWRGMVAMDILFRGWRACRARARDRSAADDAYAGSLHRIERCVETRGDVRRELGRALARFDRLPRRASSPEVALGVLGENYVRCNPTANGRLALLIEDLGAEALFPSLCEWITYTNWTARLHCRYERQHLRMLRLLAVDVVQRFDAWSIGRVTGSPPKRGRRPTLSRALRLAEPYVPRTLEGETILGIGWTVDLCRRGAGGVVHVAPFGCLAGGVVETICERISEDLGGFPILTLQFDERNTELTRTKLEGFLLQARTWQRRKR